MSNHADYITRWKHIIKIIFHKLLPLFCNCYMRQSDISRLRKSFLLRPLLLVSLLCLLSNPSAALSKLKLTYLSILYLLLCNDKKFKPPPIDPAIYFPQESGGQRTVSGAGSIVGASYRSKTVILIRHGESTWNDTFNAGDRSKLAFILFFVPNLLYAIFMEGYWFVSGKEADSWFFDSALSGKGARQSEGLRKFLKKEKMRLGSGSSGSGGGGGATNNSNNEEERAVRLLLGLEGDNTAQSSSHVVSSNLRRAISTAAIGLSDRFAVTNANSKNNKDKDCIILLPCLQEISRNPDALSILPPQGTVHPTWCDTSIPGIDNPAAFSALVNTTHHTGNKPISTNGLLRLAQFCNDVFNDDKLPKDVIIAAGHSLFFRSLFQCYLPREVEHIGKKKKIVNGGVVMFTLHEATIGKSGSIGDGNGNGMVGEKKKEYMIDPKSVVVVYGGFGKHTKG